MMTHDEMIAVITHHKNGGKVEAKSRGLSKWREVSDPSWNFDDVEFRIKPEPLVLWRIETKDGVWHFYNEEKALKDYEEYKITFPQYKATIKKFVEVTE